MTLRLRIAKPAEEELERSPAKDQGYIKAALAEMQVNLFSGDIVHLRNPPATFRRRVGNYCIFFDVHHLLNRQESFSRISFEIKTPLAK